MIEMVLVMLILKRFLIVMFMMKTSVALKVIVTMVTLVMKMKVIFIVTIFICFRLVHKHV